MYDQKTMALAKGKFLPISAKTSVVVCQYLRGKPVERVKRILNNVINMKEPIPFTKNNKSISHRPGMGPGRYPVNTAFHILALVESAEKNAQHKGLDTKSLYIQHIKADDAGTNWHYGRLRRRKWK